MLPAYKKWVPKEEVVKSMSLVSKILPPLSNQDAIRLSVMLPLLSESLENGNLPSREEKGVSDLESIHKDLATYALNSDYDATSRSAASSCLFSYIVHLAKKDTQTCPAQPLLEDVVMPGLLDASKDLEKEKLKGSNSRERVVDCLNLCSLLVR